MRTRIIIIFLFALGSLGFLQAQQATQIEATNAAINTLMYESDLGLYYSTDSVANIYTKTLNGNVVLYEILFTNGSSVLVSGSKSFIPVLAVLSSETDEPTNSLLNNYSNLPDVLKDIIDAYADAIDSVFSGVTTYDYIPEWNNLQQYNPYYRSRSNTVGPLLETKWGQDESNDKAPNAYNYFVSETSSVCGTGLSAKCPAGCVAVAMAQIMRFWNEPQEIPYKCSQYGWSLMREKLISSENYYPYYRVAVSRLIQDCATSVDMNYCSSYVYCQSTASDLSVDSALRHYYGYSDAAFRMKENYSFSEWESMLRQNLDDGYPIYYRGTSKKGRGGHAFVCDGYKKRTFANGYKYHFNFGWLGKSDGWFVICKEGNLYRFEFFYEQAAVFNCHPTNCWENIIMQCNKTFSSSTSKTYNANSVFSNAGYNYIINSGANINLTAGDEIYLSNGFYVAEGSSFTATIAPCGGAKSMDEGSDVIAQSQDSIPTTKSLQKNIEHPSGVSVYPNPVTGTLHIALLNPGESVKQVLVTNLLGKVVLQQDNLPDGTINTTPLANGMYIARICTTEGKTYHAKFVKK